MDNVYNKNEVKLNIIAIVWIFASINVLKISINSYKNIKFMPIHIVCVISVYTAFIYIFSRSIKKINFKSVLIMIFMMSMGIILRKFNILSEKFIAIFYAGLGSALMFSSIKIAYRNFVKKI